MYALSRNPSSTRRARRRDCSVYPVLYSGWPQQVWPSGNPTATPNFLRTRTTLTPTCGYIWSMMQVTKRSAWVRVSTRNLVPKPVRGRCGRGGSALQWSNLASSRLNSVVRVTDGQVASNQPWQPQDISKSILIVRPSRYSREKPACDSTGAGITDLCQMVIPLKRNATPATP